MATSFPTRCDADIIYGGKLTRYDRRTTQAQNILPMPLGGPDFRVIRTEPIVFSPFNPHRMYFAANTLWMTDDAGNSWKQISSDLTRKTFEIPATVGIFKSEASAQPKQRGVIYAVAPSSLDVNRIWAGTDDGLIWLTTDGGKNWNDITPPQLSAWQKVSVIEASHSDPQTAYAAINTLRLDDLRPHIYRTRDSGKTWTEIVNGIPANENVNAVREDPKRKGLLFAGTERAVYVSFDDGDHWQSLRLNMPATSVRDVLIKDDDLAVATHGRGFWILDDITPLRQLDDKVLAGNAYLFAPELAYRVRWNTNTDTPLPPDVPAGQNPPDGAIFNYYLKSSPSQPVTLEVVDEGGKVVRRFSSADPVPLPDPAEHSVVLAAAGGEAVERRRIPSLRMGHAPPACAGHQAGISDLGGGRQHAAGAELAVDLAGTIPRGADRRRAEVHSAADGRDGSPGEDVAVRLAEAVRFVAAGVSECVVATAGGRAGGSGANATQRNARKVDRNRGSQA